MNIKDFKFKAVVSPPWDICDSRTIYDDDLTILLGKVRHWISCNTGGAIPIYNNAYIIIGVVYMDNQGVKCQLWGDYKYNVQCITEGKWCVWYFDKSGQHQSHHFPTKERAERERTYLMGFYQ